MPPGPGWTHQPISDSGTLHAAVAQVGQVDDLTVRAAVLRAGLAGPGRHRPRTGHVPNRRFPISDWTTGWSQDRSPERSVQAGRTSPPSRSLCVPAAYQFNCTFAAQHPEIEERIGPNRSAQAGIRLANPSG